MDFCRTYSQLYVDGLQRKIDELNELLDLELPIDVVFRNGTNRKGTKLRSLAYRIRAIESVRHINIDTISSNIIKDLYLTTSYESLK